ncbi:MAG: YHS domain protein, partial [Sediminibacterium sp.]
MKKITTILILSTVLLFSATAQTVIRTKQFNLDKSTLAIQGYDPVAYFISNKAIEGKKDISVSQEGVTY